MPFRLNRSVWLLLTLASLSTWAQSTATDPLTLRAGTAASAYSFGPAQCAQPLSVAWDATFAVSLYGSRLCPEGLKLWSSSTDCGETVGSPRYDDVSSALLVAQQKGTFRINLSELPGFDGADGGVACGALGVEKHFFVCGLLTYSTNLSVIDCSVAGATRLRATPPLKITYDTLPPATPTISDVAAKDGQLSVTVTAASDVTEVEVEIRKPGDTEFSPALTITVTSVIRGTVSDLENDKTYELRARAVDGAGNKSDYSVIVSATPKHATGFWEAYRAAGGRGQGGCSTGLGLSAALAVLALRRKK